MPPSPNEPNNIALTTWRTSGTITDAVHTEDELTPEDYLWETLPQGAAAPGDGTIRDPPAWVSAAETARCATLTTRAATSPTCARVAA